MILFNLNLTLSENKVHVDHAKNELVATYAQLSVSQFKQHGKTATYSENMSFFKSIIFKPLIKAMTPYLTRSELTDTRNSIEQYFNRLKVEDKSIFTRLTGVIQHLEVHISENKPTNKKPDPHDTLVMDVAAQHVIVKNAKKELTQLRQDIINNHSKSLNIANKQFISYIDYIFSNLSMHTNSRDIHSLHDQIKDNIAQLVKIDSIYKIRLNNTVNYLKNNMPIVVLKPKIMDKIPQMINIQNAISALKKLDNEFLHFDVQVALRYLISNLNVNTTQARLNDILDEVSTGLFAMGKVTKRKFTSIIQSLKEKLPDMPPAKSNLLLFRDKVSKAENDRKSVPSTNNQSKTKNKHR